MVFNPIQKLEVFRRLSTGQKVQVGTLAQNREGVYFQYQENYLTQFGNLSPFHLAETTDLQLAPKSPHVGLHGAFADCLPDGWGLLLQDRVFRQNGILPNQVTAMDRLAFVGANALGALSFEPTSDFVAQTEGNIALNTLGFQAQALFDGQTDIVLNTLVAAGSSGGARPKAQVFFAENDWEHCRTVASQNDKAWLVKFTSQNLPLGHEEGICEATYLTMAEKVGLNPPEWKLLEVEAETEMRYWLAVKRFDTVENASVQAGRIHFQSACGLLNADFRTPSLDYETLIKATRALCRSPAAGQLQFKRAVFNLFAGNQDDHSKNWGFLQSDQGDWQVSPFYDVTFSPSRFAEHATAFMGYGKQPPLKAMQVLADAAGFSHWKQAQAVIEEVVEGVSQFAQIASTLGLTHATSQLIERQLKELRQNNQTLLQR